MEKEIVIKLNLDTKDSVNGIEAVEESFKGLSDEVTKSTEKFVSIKSQMRQLKEEAIKAGLESPIGKKAIADAAALQFKLNELNDTLQESTQDFDKFRSVVSIGQTALNSYAAFQSITALVGVENEKLLQTMVKLQAAQQLMNSLLQVKEGLEQKNAMLTTLSATAQKAYTLAVGTSTGGLKAFRLALIGTGIGAIIVGLGLLIANFEKVSEWVKDSINKLREYKKYIAFILPPLYLLIEGYDLMMKALQKLGIVQSEETKKSIEGAEKRIESLVKEETAIGSKYDYEIAKAKAAGKNTVELEQMKRNALIERIKAEAQATLMLVKLNGEFTDDQKKRIKELSDMAVKLTQDSVVARIAEEKRLSDEHKKELDKRKKDKEDAKKEEDDKRFEEWEKEAEIREQELQIEAEAEAKRQEVLASINDDYFTEQVEKSDAQQVYREQKDIESLIAKQKIEKLKAEAVAKNLDMTANILSQFSDIAGKETATGKGLAVAAATINTYRGVSDALAATTITPFETGLKFANAAAIGIAGFMNVRKILAVKIPKQSGGGGMGTGISLPTAGGGVSSSPTQTATPLNPDGTLTSSLTGGTSTPAPQPVVVLESDIQRATQRNQQSISMSEL